MKGVKAMANSGNNLEIRYCVPWGYLPQAAWIATEFFTAFGGKLNISLTPVGEGRLEVALNGETIFDRKTEGGKYPDHERVGGMKQAVSQKIQTV